MLIQELTLDGILSFGTDTPPLEMRPLNVLIGPNGSGKSNVVESLGLLCSAATHLTAPMRGRGGSGVKEWIWKGSRTGHAKIEAIVKDPSGIKSLRHRIEFAETASRFDLVTSRTGWKSTVSGNYGRGARLGEPAGERVHFSR